MVLLRDLVSQCDAWEEKTTVSIQASGRWLNQEEVMGRRVGARGFSQSAVVLVVLISSRSDALDFVKHLEKSLKNFVNCVCRRKRGETQMTWKVGSVIFTKGQKYLWHDMVKKKKKGRKIL